MARLSLLLPALLALVLTAQNAVAALQPDHAMLKLLPGQGGFTVTYAGSVSNCTGLRVETVPGYGFNPVVVSKSCSGGVLRVTLRFDGEYTGTEGPYTPIRIHLPDGTEVEVEPVNLEAVRVTGVDCRVDRVYGLVVEPPEPEPEEPIIVAPRVKLSVSIRLSDYPSFPASVVVEAGGAKGTGRVDSAYETLTLEAVLRENPLHVRVRVGSVTTASAQCSVSGVPVAVLTVTGVYPTIEDGRRVYAGTVTVSKADYVTIRVSLEPGGGSVTVTEPGVYELVSRVESRTYTYTVTVDPVDGQPVTFTVSSTALGRASVGELAGFIVLAVFAAIYIASIVSMVLGMLLGRLELISVGVLSALGAFTVLMAIVAATAAARLFVAMGAPDPAGVARASLANLPDVFDRAVSYVSGEAKALSGRVMAITLGTAAAVVGAAAAALAAGGGLGWLSAGAVSIATGEIVGSVVSAVFWMVLLGSVASTVLSALGDLYPLLVGAALVVVYALTLFRVFASMLSGNVAGIAQSAVDLGAVILVVLVAPSLLAVVEESIHAVEFTISIGPLSIPVPVDPVAYIVRTFLAAGLLGSVIGFVAWRVLGMGRS